MSKMDKLEKFLSSLEEDSEWDTLPTEEKLGRNVIYFMKKWGETQKDNAIYRQENAELEEETKSLRASILDLQSALEVFASYMSDNPEFLKRGWQRYPNPEVARETLDRLKAAGNYVENEK